MADQNDRWRRLEALFTAACELPPDERSTFVETETADDPDLRRDLNGMLAHASDGGARIARAIAAGAAAFPGPARIGRYLGPYRIIREIGRGGMGVVFEALRDDDEYRKTVALKVAPLWTDVASVRERFRLERQILAGLEHPNIARLLDGGTEDGVPYFVMEYVDGLPITEFCDTHALDMRARLALVRQVCAAVHFAHEHLVVHRDLKPSNILVSDEGVPKLLDFGIAKLLDPFADGAATSTGERRWTPNYTSPEQVRGRPVTTRTDVYSLGLVLYELLAGERAQAADASSAATLERSICETEPPLPSARAAARFGGAWANRLRGDLDSIVMMAIRKEPERRYGTVAALANDLDRYLDGRPVLARPNTPAYRAGKFVRRHRVAVVAGVSVLVSLAVGLGVAVYEARRAERRFQQVRTLANAFVFDVHDRIVDLSGATEARKAIVQTALTYLESLRPDAPGDAALSRELAAAYVRIGDAQGAPQAANLGDAAGALVSYTRAMDLLTPLVGRNDREARREFVRVETAIARLKEDQGELAEVPSRYALSEEVGEALVREGPVDTALLETVAVAFAADSHAANTAGDYTRSERTGRRAIELSQRAVAMDATSRALRDDLGLAYATLGQSFHRTLRLREAADLYRQALDIREGLVKENPDNTAYRHNLLVNYGNLADVLASQPWQNLGDTSGAIVMLEKAAALAELSRRTDPSDRGASFDLVNAKYRLGLAMTDDPSRLDAALANYAEAARLTKELRAQDPKRFVYTQFDGLLEWRSGQALLLLGRPDAAAKRFDAARTIAAGWLGTSGATLRSLYVRSTAALAALRAQAGDIRAGALAADAARQLALLPPGPINVDAPAYRSVGAAYLEVARRTPATRPAMLEEAVRHLEKSAQLLRSFKVPPEVEPRRQRELHDVEGELAACHQLSDRAR